MTNGLGAGQIGGGIDCKAVWTALGCGVEGTRAWRGEKRGLRCRVGGLGIIEVEFGGLRLATEREREGGIMTTG